jgi:ABC-type nitrate/sulfonate/bicarbonate transport system substrate-binding protein
MKSRIRTLVASLAMLVGASQAMAADPMRVGYIIGLEVVPFYVMQARAAEIEEELGFALEWVPFSRTSDQLNAFRSGQLDIVESGTSALAALQASGTELRVIRGFHNLSFKILTHDQSGIASVADLAGRQLGVASLVGTSYVGTAMALSINGVDPASEVQVTTGSPPNLIAALETRRLDAVTLWEPFITRAMASGNLVEVADIREVYEAHYGETFLQTAFAVTLETFEARREDLARFNAAVDAAIAFAIEAPEEANAIALAVGGEELGLDAEELAFAREGFADAWALGGLDEASIAAVQNSFDRMMELGLQEEAVDIASFWVAP